MDHEQWDRDPGWDPFRAEWLRKALLIGVHAHRGHRPEKANGLFRRRKNTRCSVSRRRKNWSDDHGNYWSLHNGGNTILGLVGECTVDL